MSKKVDGSSESGSSQGWAEWGLSAVGSMFTKKSQLEQPEIDSERQIEAPVEGQRNSPFAIGKSKAKASQRLPGKDLSGRQVTYSRNSPADADSENDEFLEKSHKTGQEGKRRRTTTSLPPSADESTSGIKSDSDEVNSDNDLDDDEKSTSSSETSKKRKDVDGSDTEADERGAYSH